jgi:hypothetical protein
LNAREGQGENMEQLREPAVTSSSFPSPAERSPSTAASLWLSVLASPIAWVIDLSGRYFLIRTANQHNDVHLLHVVTALTFSVVVLAALGSAAHWRHARHAGGDDPRRATTVTLATWGLGFAAFFGLLILANAFPAFVLTPRDLT